MFSKLEYFLLGTTYQRHIKRKLAYSLLWAKNNSHALNHRSTINYFKLRTYY